jgi:hypothetical protein
MTDLIPYLADADLASLLKARGYGVTATTLTNAVMPTAGVCGMLRFGDDVARLDGVADVAVRLAAQVRGTGRAAVTQWKLRKIFAAHGPHQRHHHRLQISLQVDLLVSGQLTAGFIRSRGRDGHRLICHLLDDLKRSIFAAPALRQNGNTGYLEFALIGDLVAGRSGLVRGSPTASAAEQALRLAVCDRLKHEVLSDLGSVLRDAARLLDRATPAPAASSPLVPTATETDVPSVQPFTLPDTLMPTPADPVTASHAISLSLHRSLQ